MNNFTKTALSLCGRSLRPLAAALLLVALTAACIPFWTVPGAAPTASDVMAPAEESLNNEFALAESDTGGKYAAADGDASHDATSASVMNTQQHAPLLAAEAPPPQRQPLPTPDTMIFQDYGINPFVETDDDNLSTFALDVDTGAYTVMRNYVNEGLLPPPEAVRVEEFVNYFDYRYPAPDADEVFSIQLDAAPVPWKSENDQNPSAYVMRVGIQGYEVAPEARQDVALTFVIDVSGSMEREDRLTLAKRALNLLVEELRPTDSVGIVVYGSRARTVLEPTSAANKNEIASAIYSLHTEGSTNAEAGLRLAYRLAWENFNPQVLNRVILISDGVANVGATGPDSIWTHIEQYADEGITLTSVGMGLGNYNDVLMEQLANMGNGTYAYVDNIGEARRIFVDELTGTLQTIAKDAKVQVEFNRERVARYRLLGYENRDVADEDFRNDSVDAGEIGAGHSVTALYELVLSDVERPNEQDEIVTVHLRWHTPEGGEANEKSKSMPRAEILAAFTDAAPDVQLAVSVARVAEVLRESDWISDDAISMSLLDDLARLEALMPGDEKVEEFVDLVERMALIGRN